jgi:TPR repeat protein
MYELGWVDGTANSDWALRLLSDKAQTDGNTEAEARFGAMVRDGLGCKANVELGLRYIEASAQKGSGRGMAELGWCYERGLGVCMDTERALAFYASSAHAKCGDGYFLWGCAIVERQRERAEQLWTWGAKRLHPGCCWKLGDLRFQQGQREKGLELLADAADQGLVEAPLQLVRASPAEGERQRYLRDAAVCGNPDAQWQLGLIYQSEQKAKMALQCFRMAAETVPAALARLIEIYENGDAHLGVRPDSNRAAFWKGIEDSRRAARKPRAGLRQGE